jgi:mono/diheme cytochrome c family protein
LKKPSKIAPKAAINGSAAETKTVNHRSQELISETQYRPNSMSRLSVQILLTLMTVLTTAGLLFFVARREEARLARAEAAQEAQAIEVGAELYQIHCRSCHGVNGEGVGQLGPPLSDEHFFTNRLAEVGWPGTLEEYILAVTTTGRQVATRPIYAGDGTAVVMAPWSQKYGGPLRDDQIRNVAAFVLNWEATALGRVELTALEIPRASAGDPAAILRGEEHFVAAGCANCHTIEGISEGQTGPELTQIGAVAGTRKPDLSAEDYIRESFLIPYVYIVEGYESEDGAVMCGGILSEPQLDEVVAFLLSQQ